MNESSEKAEAAKKTAEEVKQDAKKKLEEAKVKVGLGKAFAEFVKQLKPGPLKSALAIIVGIFSGKLANLKEDVEKSKKKKEVPKKADNKTETENEEDKNDEEKPPMTPANDNALPDNLTGVKYTSENILKCKDIEQCQALMKANGFVLDTGTGNYINPRWLSPDKILNEPMTEATIGGRKIRLKQSIMARLKRADEAMFDETGEHIKIGENYRSNEHQFDLYKKLKPNGGRVASPGGSFHELGQAVDLPENWEKAQKYMWAQGFIGGKLPIGLRGDANHFSVGEMKMNDARIAALKGEDIKTTQRAA